MKRSHKLNRERRWQKAQREFRAHCRPVTEAEFSGAMDGGIGKIESFHVYTLDPCKFMGKRELRRWRRDNKRIPYNHVSCTSDTALSSKEQEAI